MERAPEMMKEKTENNESKVPENGVEISAVEWLIYRLALVYNL